MPRAGKILKPGDTLDSSGGEDTPARSTAAWAAGWAPVRGAWAVHGGRLGKVAGVDPGVAHGGRIPNGGVMIH